MRIRLDELTGCARERVLAAMRGATVVNNATCKDSLQVAKELRYPKAGLNKTERRYYDAFLRERRESGEALVMSQQVRIPLEGVGGYIPDFVVWAHGGVEVVEIKGGYKGAGWEQGWDRYKRAAAYLERFGVKCTLAEWMPKEHRWNIQTWETMKNGRI